MLLYFQYETTRCSVIIAASCGEALIARKNSRNNATAVSANRRFTPYLMNHDTARESSPCPASVGGGVCVSGSARFC